MDRGELFGPCGFNSIISQAAYLFSWSITSRCLLRTPNANKAYLPEAESLVDVIVRIRSPGSRLYATNLISSEDTQALLLLATLACSSSALLLDRLAPLDGRELTVAEVPLVNDEAEANGDSGSLAVNVLRLRLACFARDSMRRDMSKRQRYSSGFHPDQKKSMNIINTSHCHDY